MSLIKLAGYEFVFDGVFKSARNVNARSCEGKSILVREVIGLQKYRVPFEEDVVEYVLEKARNLCKDPEKYEEHEKGLVALLKDLPKGDMQELSIGEEETRDLLRLCTSAKERKEGDISREYLAIRFGYTIDDLLEKISDAVQSPIGRVENSFSPVKFRGVGLGQDWSMKVLIYNPLLDEEMYDGVLPKKEQIRILLKHGVKESDTMYLDRMGAPNYQRIFDIISDAIKTDFDISEVMEITEAFLDNCGIDCVQTFVRAKESKRRIIKSKGKEELIKKMSMILKKSVVGEVPN